MENHGKSMENHGKVMEHGFFFQVSDSEVQYVQMENHENLGVDVSFEAPALAAATAGISLEAGLSLEC